MTPTPASFRAARPEFADAAKYSDAAVSAALTVARLRVNDVVWAELTDYGIYLLVAHNLTLSALASRAMASGGSATSSGVVTSKSVDRVSVSYDSGAATFDGAGTYNLTPYGVEFWQMAQMLGAGGAQL